VPRLVLANERQVESVYRESFMLWGAGLRPKDYRALWEDVRATPWAAKQLSFYVWLDERDRVLSSMKVYRPQLRLSGRASRIYVFGAIFTPDAQRRRGHASAMIRAAREQASRSDASVILLFSDIGTRFYEDIGFVPLAAEEQWGRLRADRPGPSGGMTLRPMRDNDADAVRRAHEASSAAREIAILRDREHWEFLQVRSSSFFSRLDDPDIRQVSWSATRAGRFAGYLIAVEGRGEWNVREVGAVDGEPRSMAAILRLGAAEARRAGLGRCYSWLPPSITAHLRDWGLRGRQRQRAIPMVLPLSDAVVLERLASPEAAYIPYLDQF
jgi:predicted N-acetyltransferase YhbS